MADKFNARSQEWEPHEPGITWPTQEAIDAPAWEELNDRARRIREILNRSKLDGNVLVTDIAGEPVFIVQTNRAPEPLEPPLPPAA